MRALDITMNIPSACVENLTQVFSFKPLLNTSIDTETVSFTVLYNIFNVDGSIIENKIVILPEG